jgi:hypothetical protein
VELEGGDSCSMTNLVETPVSKVGAKRYTDSVESLDAIRAEIGKTSITKLIKMVRVKCGPEEGK